MSNNDVFVFLDLDNTLFDFSKAETLSLTEALFEFGVDVTDDIISSYKLYNVICWEALERGEMTRHEVLVTRFKMLFEKFGLSANVEKVQAIYEKGLENGCYFIPGAEALLENLSGKYRLFIVSNGNTRVQESRLGISGISHYFEDIFISENIGVDKPAKEFFDRCFSRIDGFNRDRSIIIGDSLTSDIQGGINAGIKTCLFDPTNKHIDCAVPDYKVSSLGDIPTLLSVIF